MRTLFHVLVTLLGLLAACNSLPPGFLNTAVLEPAGLGTPIQSGLKYQGTTLQEGTLTFSGKGQVQTAFSSYIDAMRGQGWNPSSSDGDPLKGLRATLIKDTRTLSMDVKPGPDGTVQMVIRVASK